MHDPRGWERFRDYVHAQVRELLTGYGRIDVIWFDGAWPHTAADWRSAELVDMIRSLQPDILINNRLGAPSKSDRGPTLRQPSAQDTEAVGHSAALGDFGTPEHEITADPARLWESCQVSTWRLGGFTIGERWRPADLLLDDAHRDLTRAEQHEGKRRSGLTGQVDAVGRDVAL